MNEYLEKKTLYWQYLIFLYSNYFCFSQSGGLRIVGVNSRDPLSDSLNPGVDDFHSSNPGPPNYKQNPLLRLLAPNNQVIIWDSILLQTLEGLLVQVSCQNIICQNMIYLFLFSCCLM